MESVKSVEEIVNVLACVWNSGVTFSDEKLLSYQSRFDIAKMGARKRLDSTLGYFVEYAHSGLNLLHQFNIFASSYDTDIYFIQYDDIAVKEYWTGLCYSCDGEVNEIMESLVKHLQIDSFRRKFVAALNERVDHKMGVITSYKQALVKLDANVVKIIMDKINEEEEMNKGVIKELMKIEKDLVESWKYYVSFGPKWSHDNTIVDMKTFNNRDHKLKLIDDLCGTFVGKWTKDLKPLVADLTDSILVRFSPENGIVDIYAFNNNESTMRAFNGLEGYIFDPITAKNMSTIVANIVVRENASNIYTDIPGTSKKLYRLSTDFINHMVDLAKKMADNDRGQELGDRDGDPIQTFQSQRNILNVGRNLNFSELNHRFGAPGDFNTPNNRFIQGSTPTQGWPSNVQSPFSSNMTPVIPQTGKVQCAVFKSRKDDTSVPEGMIQFLNRGELLDIHTHENYEYIYRTVTIRVK